MAIEERKNDIIQLYKSGSKVREITFETGFTSHAIYSALRRWGAYTPRRIPIILKNQPVNNSIPISPEPELVASKAFFPHKDDCHNWDYGTTAYELTEQLKNKKKLDELYNQYSKVRYMSSITETERTRRLSLLDDELIRYEELCSEAYLRTRKSISAYNLNLYF